MVAVDVIFVASLVMAGIVGVRQGLVSSFAFVVGVAAGTLAASVLIRPLIDALPPSTLSVALLSLLAILVSLIGAGLGLLVAHAQAHRARRRPVVRVLRGVVSLLVAALGLSFSASAITSTAPPALASALSSSRVLEVVDDLTPAGVGTGMSFLYAAVVDADAESRPAAGELQRPVDLDPAVVAAGASVALVSGMAAACDRGITGSAFALAPDLFVTNAHVVAGVDAPHVILPSGAAGYGWVVHVDTALDLAVIRVSGLGATPLTLAEDLDIGDQGAVHGHPWGGALETTAARVMWRSLVTVPGTHGEAAPPRDVYAIEAEVVPGDSGGPLLTSHGTVAGIVFARGDGARDVGFAITADALRPLVERLPTLTRPVDTGACLG